MTKANLVQKETLEKKAASVKRETPVPTAMTHHHFYSGKVKSIQKLIFQPVTPPLLVTYIKQRILASSTLTMATGLTPRSKTSTCWRDLKVIKERKESTVKKVKKVKSA